MLRMAPVLLLCSLLLLPTALADLDPEGEVDDCVKAIVTGGSYYSDFFQCDQDSFGPVVGESLACARAHVYGGEVRGDFVQCRGLGVLPAARDVLDHPLVRDVLGCALAIANGESYHGQYLDCA